MATPPGAVQPTTAQQLRKELCLGTFAVSLRDASVFVDPTSADVAAYIAAHDVLPQRAVLDANVNTLAEALGPGSLDSSYRTPGTLAFFPLDLWNGDPNKQAEIRMARMGFVRDFVASDAWVGSVDGDHHPHLPPLDQRVSPTTSSRSLSPAQLQPLHLYILDGNHRAAVMAKHAAAGAHPEGRDPDDDVDYSLFFDLYSSAVFDHPALFFSLSLELNQIHSRTSIRQTRSLAATIAMVRVARVQERGADTVDFSGNTVLPNDFGSLTTSLYRFTLLDEAFRRHSATAVMLDCLAHEPLKKVMGYGQNGLGPAVVYLLFALQDTAEAFRILDPSGAIVSTPSFLRNFSRRLGKAPENPFFGIALEGNAVSGTLAVGPSVQQKAGELARALRGGVRIRARTDPVETKQLLSDFANRLSSRVPPPAGESRWENDQALLKSFASPTMEHLVDAYVLSQLNPPALGEPDVEAVQTQPDEDIKPTARTPSRKGRAKSAATSSVAADYETIHGFATSWFHPFSFACATVVPLMWDDTSARLPVKPPRPGWFDPFLLLLALKPEARARLANDPFSPFGGLSASKFEHIPTRPFAETKAEANALAHLAKWCWLHRDELALEHAAAAAAASDAGGSNSGRLAIIPTAAEIGPTVVPFCHPALLVSSLPSLSLSMRQQNVWFYRAHRDFAVAVSTSLDLPSFAAYTASYTVDYALDGRTRISAADTLAQEQAAQAARAQAAQLGAHDGQGVIAVNAHGRAEGHPPPEGDKGMHDSHAEVAGAKKGEGNGPLADGRKKRKRGPSSSGKKGRGDAQDEEEYDDNDDEDDDNDGDDDDEDEDEGEDGLEGGDSGDEEGLNANKDKDDVAAPPRKRRKETPLAPTIRALHALLFFFAAAGQEDLRANERVLYGFEAGKTGAEMMDKLEAKFAKPELACVLDESSKSRSKKRVWLAFAKPADASELRKIEQHLASRGDQPVRPITVTAPTDPFAGADKATKGFIALVLASLHDPAFSVNSLPMHDLPKLASAPSNLAAYFKLLAAVVGSGTEASARRRALGGDGPLKPANTRLAAALSAPTELAEQWAVWAAGLLGIKRHIDARRSLSPEVPASSDDELMRMLA